eukprot:scaffold39912_cov62-Phaeocystis_antarctica.AAC.8
MQPEGPFGRQPLPRRREQTSETPRAMEISLPAREDNPTPLAQLDPDILYSPEELAEPAAALVAKMSLEEAASPC